MTQAIRTTLLLLIGIMGCGGRTDLPGNTFARASGSAGGSVHEIPSGGGASSTLTGGALPTGGSPNGTGANGTGGSRPDRKTARWVSTGSAHTCAVLSDGSIECWGMNDSGELGDGTFTHRRAPVKVQGVSNATLVVTGYDHSCAVLSDGGLSCWGSNAQGQLGTGTSVGSASPVPVPGLTNVTNVDVGGLPGHTCALTASHSVYCWGNASSDPSDPENAKRATPQLVSQLVAVAAGVSVGGKHSCALLTFGTVECWGDNAYGQLGNGTLLNADAPSASLNAGATLLAAGGNNTCVITPEMRVECWGSNSAGQLGNSAVQVGPGFASSGPVTVEGIESATRLSVGSAHACATLAQGTVQCWGDNRNGELGNGSTVDSTQPVSVSGIATARGIAAGGYHTCALTETGRVYCWGSNLLGQLGLGTTTGSSWLPGLVVGF